jgi:hypothetical protein
VFEMLANIDQVPESGARVVATFPKTEKRFRISGARLRDLPALSEREIICRNQLPR